MSTKPVVLVTGAAKRIGAALCRHFHQKGYRVVLHYRSSQEAAQALARELNLQTENSCICLQANLNKQTDIEQLAKSALQQWGRIDVLINNASSFYPTEVGSCTEQQWDELIGSNVKAPFFLCQALEPALKANNGSIINFADIHADKPMAKHSIYNMAKAANVMLSKTLALEFAPNIRVNGIAPGAILWPEEGGENPDILKKIPMQRSGDEQAICQAAWYLTEQAPYTTGQILTVDGGRSLHM